MRSVRIIVFSVLLATLAVGTLASADSVVANLTDGEEIYEENLTEEMNLLYQSEESLPFTSILENTSYTVFDDFMNTSKTIPFARFLQNTTAFGNFSNLTTSDTKPPFIDGTWFEAFFGAFS